MDIVGCEDYLDYGIKNSVQLYPDKVAISYYEGSDSLVAHWTYKQLEAAANTVSLVLGIHALHPDPVQFHEVTLPSVSNSAPDYFVVVILSDHPPSTVACMLGILKHGAFFYISKDVSHTELLRIFKIVCPNAILVDENCYQKLNNSVTIERKCKLSVLDRSYVMVTMSFMKNENGLHSNTSNNIDKFSYVITTSGSTGHPKIVYVPHKCIVPNIKDFSHIFNVNEYDVILGISRFTFDPSIVDIFLSLNSGAHLILLSPEIILRPSNLINIFLINSITILQATPTHLKLLHPHFINDVLLSDGPKHLKVLALGGEAFPPPVKINEIVGASCKTRIFNLYGLTEVSCWSSCHEVNVLEYTRDCTAPSSSLARCCIGTPLTETTMKVVNESGKEISEGVGIIAIGGSRICCNILTQDVTEHCLNDSSLKSGLFFTGDTGYINKNKIYYLGRENYILKRNGCKISLAEIEYVGKCLTGISDCCAVSAKNCIYFYVSLISGSQMGVTDISKLLAAQLTVWKLPDEIFIMDELPINENGKVDRIHLVSRSCTYFHDKYFSLFQSAITMSSLQELIAESTGGCRPEVFDKLINIGVDSLKAFYLCNKIQSILDKDLPLLLPTLLDGTLSDVYNLIKECEDVNIKPTGTEMVLKPSEETDLDSQGLGSVKSAAVEVTNVSRRGCFVNTVKYLQHLGEFSMMEIAWKVDLEKCVDSSPLLVELLGKSYAFIGSHAHKFYCIDISTSEVMWTAALPDRIEASAAISVDGDKVYVGCYDANLYCFDVSSGKIIWKFPTGGPIKCTVFVDHRTRYLVFGSHDRHIYCIDEGGVCIWKHKICNGSIFSSPIVHDGRVYAATLDGYLSCNAVISGKCNWVESIGKPVFSSLAPFSKGVVFGCTDSNIYSYSFEGIRLWRFATKAPVFSSPFVVEIETSTVIAVGSHDHCLYFLNDSGGLLKSFVLASPIYATPYLTVSSSYHDILNIKGAICETNGTVVLFSYKYDNKSCGTLDIYLQTKYIGSEIFSSPVILHNKLYTGCRNNYFYCIEFCKLSKTEIL